jgi:hypothetical protein
MLSTKILIIQKGFTQRQAALDAAIPEARLSAAIHGRCNLTDAETRRLAGVLGVQPSSLAPVVEEHATA